EDKKFLLTKAESGRWDLPGGGLDWGEDPQAGVAREIQEEMGIATTFVAKNPSYFVATRTEGGRYEWINNIIYIAKLQHLNFTPSDECLEIQFFSIEEAIGVPTFSNVKQFIKLYDASNH
ncbi:MAG: NUDIX hydrolase, partial [Candidatus Andersenbacteria bacterium]